jgi:alpha-tubulin suppressor-like RCC1 family protein
MRRSLLRRSLLMPLSLLGVLLASDGAAASPGFEHVGRPIQALPQTSVVAEGHASGESPAVGSSPSGSSSGAARSGPPRDVQPPTISGEAREGRELVATPGTWSRGEPIEYTYRWRSCDAQGGCVGATGPTYPLRARDVGDTVSVEVTATNGTGSATASSNATAAVLPQPGGGAMAWGENFHGQLGTLYRDLLEESPVAVEGQQNIAQVAVGAAFSAALLGDGTVSASGAGRYGSIGYGGRKASWEQGKSHVPVSGLGGVRQIAAASAHGLALLQNGTVETWGNNAYGTLGNGTGGFERETGESQLTPKVVKALVGLPVRSVAAGGGADYAVLEDGQVMAWGHNNKGQLGVTWPVECQKLKTCEPQAETVRQCTEHGTCETGVENPEHKCFTETGWELCGKVPRVVLTAGGQPLEHVVVVSAGFEVAYALLEDGEVVSWGNDSQGQLGQDGIEPGPHTSFTPPGPVTFGTVGPLTGAVEIAAGRNHALARLRNGQVVGWGDNERGALGPLSGEGCGHEERIACDRNATVIAGLGEHVLAISAGSGYSLALRGGRVYAVGSNKYGMLGNGGKCENPGGALGYYGVCFDRVPAAVPGLEHVRAISAGTTDVLALQEAGFEAPKPMLVAEPQALAVGLRWALPAGEGAERLLYRGWEHPEGSEAEEAEEPTEGSESEGESEGSGSGEPAEEGTDQPPADTTLPRLRVLEVNGEEVVVVKTEVAVGQYLEASPGNWSGSRPMAFEYGWLRCRNGECATIPGAQADRYQLAEEDAQSTVEVKVTARNGVKPDGVAISEPSAVVKGQGEGRRSKAESIKLKDRQRYVIDQLHNLPLSAVPYEVKLASGTGAKGERKTRTFVVTPLP